MTRYTNFARKRTYVEAELHYRDDQASSSVHQGQTDHATNSDTHGDAAIVDKITGAPPLKPVKKKKKKSKADEGQKHTVERDVSADASADVDPGQETRSKEDAHGESEAGPGEQAAEGESDAPKKRSRGAIRSKLRMQRKRVKDAEARKEASERRRLKRKDGRDSQTICFACRERGHAARDCTRAVVSNGGNSEEQEPAGVTKSRKGREAVGICYRCGSRKHNLSRCQEEVDPSNPLPFASCFVCSGKGHLASSCPQNQSKGIYPDGGCCKLCGETTHLAKNCPLRQKEVVAATTVLLGTGNAAGADEDDFHTFKRRNAEVDKLEKVAERVKRQANVKVGAHTGVVKAFGQKPAVIAKKVVSF